MFPSVHLVKHGTIVLSSYLLFKILVSIPDLEILHAQSLPGFLCLSSKSQKIWSLLTIPTFLMPLDDPSYDCLTVLTRHLQHIVKSSLVWGNPRLSENVKIC